MANLESINGITLVTEATAADSGFMSSYNPGSKYFCANGLEVTISERTDAQGGYTASWTFEGESYSMDLAADVILIGGAWDSEVASVSIIMNGGTVNHIYGGGVTANADVTGDISVVVNGGNIINLNGAGGCGSVGGNVNITVGNEEGGPAIAHDIIGGGWFEGADVAGNVTITLNNGKLGNAGADGYPCEFIAGGGVFADVEGKVTVNVNGGQYDAIVTGGTMISGNVAKVEVNMTGGKVIQLNGSCVDYYVQGNGSVGDVVINVSGGTVQDAVIGGSIYKADVTGTVEINVSGGVINTYGGKEAIIAGSNFIDGITGTTSVNITADGENVPELNGIITKSDDTKLNGEAVDMSVIYVDGNAAGSDLANRKLLGVNLFNDVNAAEAAAENGAAKMVIAEGTEAVYTKDQYYFLNTNPDEGGANNAFDYVVDAAKTYDMQIDGTFKAYQILLNNAETVVSSTGKAFATGEAFRVMGGTIAVRGTRTEGAGVPGEIFTGSWGGGTKAGADTQIDAGYFQINQGATADFDDTVVFVHAGLFSIDNSKADFDNTYIYLGSGGTYADNQVKFTNGAEVLFSNNSTLVPDAAFGLHITVDGTSSLTVSDSEIKAVDTVTNAGSIVLENGGSLEAGEFSNVALVTIDGFAKGAARDVTIAFIPAGSGTSRSITVSLAANATSLNLALDNVADGNYNLTVIDGTSAFMVNNVDVVNGKINVNGGIFTADSVSVGKGTFDIDGESSVNVAALDGVANVKGGTLTDSVIGGVVAVTGDTTLEGSNDFSKIWVSGGTLTVDGSLVTQTTYPGFFVIGNDETVNDGEKGYYNGFIGTEAGEMIVNGSYTAEEGVVGNGGKLTVKGEMTATCLYLRGGETTVAEGGSLTGIVWGGVDAGASLVVDGGTFATAKGESGESFSNAGTFTVKGSSTLDIVNFASGTLTVEAGTTLTDSTVAGAGVVQFAADSTTTFEGENKITAALDNSVAGFDFVVNENASLLITRYTLGYDRNITVKGTIEDATALETLDGVTLSLKADSPSGFSIGGWGTSVLDVDNAYVDLGKSTWKSATGTYTWSFTNSYVTVGCFGNTTAGSSADASWVSTFDDSVLVSDTYLKTGKGMEVNFINGSVATIKGSMRIDGVLNINDTSSLSVNGYFNNKVGVADEHSDILGTVNVAGTMNIKGTGPVELIGGSVNVQDGGTLNLVNDNGSRLDVLVDADSELNIDGNFTAGTITNNGEFAISGESTVDAALIKGNDVTVSGTLKDSNITFETFDYETGNMMVDGEVVVDGGSFKNVQFRANAGEKVTLEGDIVAAGATQIKAVDGEVVVNGSFTGSGSTIEMEGDDALLTITENAKVDIAEGFFLNGSTTVITGTLADDADLTALAKDDAQVKGAYSTWGSTYAADVTLSDTYVWNAMISINNADTVVTLDNSRLTGWMSFDVSGGTLTATNGSFIEHQAAEGWAWGSIGADAAIVLTDGSTFDAAKTDLTFAGSITVDATSSFIANTLTGEGTITINAKGFTEGINKVIDLSGSTSLEGKVTISDREDGTAVYYLADGDVILCNADMSVLYVGSQYDVEFGTEVAEGKFAGINAFASLEKALAFAEKNTTVTRIEIDCDITETTTAKTYNITQNLTIGAAAPVSVTLNGANLNIYQMNNNSSVTIEENVTLAGAGIVANGFATSNNELVIDGTLKALTLKQWTSNNKITVSETGKVVLGYGDGQFDMAYGNGVVNVNGTLTDTTDLSAGPQFQAGYSGTRGNGNVLNLTNTYFEAGRDFTFNGSNGTINASNSIFKISGGDFAGALNMNSTGNTVNLNDGSRLIVANATVNAGNALNVADSRVEIGTLTNGGTVTLSDAVFTADKVTNSGTFTVSGESTIQIGALTGTYVKMTDATLVGDSKIGGNARTYDSFALAGTLSVSQTNFYGETVIKEGAVLNGSTTIVSGGSEFLLENGGTINSRFFNVVGGTADIEGKIDLLHSDPRQKLLQIHEGGVANINAGGNITIDGHNAWVKEGGTLNINGGTLNVERWDGRDVGGILYNEGGTVTIDWTGLLTAATIDNQGTITVDAEGFDGTWVKVIDVDSAITGNNVVLANGSGYYLSTAADGDIYLYKSPETIYVNCDYNSSTEGWGYNRFGSINSAENYAVTSSPKATVIVEKTTTVSGNSFQIIGNKNESQNGLKFIIKDGALAGNANSKWDMVATVTVEAGGKLVTSRPLTASAGYVHAKDTLTLAGDKENGKYAILDFGKGTHNSIDFATLGGGKVVADYADATFGDFSLQAGSASFTDSVVTVEGALSTGLGIMGRLTLTGTTVNVNGHHSRSDTYFKGFNQLKYVTMTDSSIVIDDGAEDTVADNVTLHTVTMTGSEISVEAGTDVEVTGKVTMNDESLLRAGKITLAKGSNITMDIESTIEFTSIVTALEVSVEGIKNVGGTITVSDAASYVDNAGVADGTYKLLDYTGDAAMTADDYKVILNDVWHDNYLVFNNDLYLTDQDTDIVHVSAEWKDAEKGSINADGSIIGFNAAGNVKDLANMINTDGRDTTVKFHTDMEVVDTVDFAYGTGDILFTADQAVTIAQTSAGKDFGFTQAEDITVTVGENVTFQIYNNASGWYQYYGPSLELYGTITGGQNWGCTYLFNGEHTVHSTGTLSTGRIQLGFTTLNVEGDAESERTAAHIDTNYLLVEGSTFNAENAIVKAGIIHDSNNGGMCYGASEFNFSNSQVTAGNMTIQYADSVVEVKNSVFNVTGTLSNAGAFNVTGESTILIGNLAGSGAMVLDNAKLTASSITKGNVNIKGANTFSGDFNASYAFVGDWNDGEYSGSIDFGTNSSVNVGGQMIIGYDYGQMGENNVVFGDVTGAVTTDGIFKAADVSVRRDGTLTIANTTGDNKINTMNVMGKVVIDNAKLSGEVQIGTGSADYNAEMIVKNGAEVTLGGSSNSIVILGKSGKGTLTVDNADLTVDRCGAGAGYSVPADTFVIGYNGGQGFLNVKNNATFNALYNVQVNEGSAIAVEGASSASISKNLENNGEVTVSGAETTLTADSIENNAALTVEKSAALNAGTLKSAGEFVVDGAKFVANEVSLYTLLTFDITAGEERTISVSFIPVDAFEGVTVKLQAEANATSVSYEGIEIADGKYYVTVFDGETSVRSEIDVVGGSFDVKGESTLRIAALNGFAALRDGAVLSCSKVGGLVKVFGSAALKGDNGITALNVGKGYDGAESLTVAGTATFGTVEVGNAALNITEGTVVTANTNTFAAGSTVSIDNADYNARSVTVVGALALTNGALLRAEDSFSVSESGSVTIDTASGISFAGAFVNAGVITVDMTDFADTIYRVVDYTGTGSMDLADYGELKAAEGFTFTVKDNDLYVTTGNFDFGDAKINSNWSGAEDAEALEEGRVFGINAFASIDDIADAEGKISGLTKLTISNTEYAKDLTFTDEALPIVLENTELSGEVTVTGAGILLDADSSINAITAAKGVHLSGTGSVGSVTGSGLFDAKGGITVDNVSSFNLAYLNDVTVTDSFIMTNGSDELYVNGDITVGTIDFLQGSADKMVIAGGVSVEAAVIESSGNLSISMKYAGETAITVTGNGAFGTNSNLVIDLTGFTADADGESLLVSGITEFAGSIKYNGASYGLNDSIIIEGSEYKLNLTDEGLALVFNLDVDYYTGDFDGNGTADVLCYQAA
ncbi:MAG: hypothetical protein E7048_08210, partial [Lentisphaerae bacterium]|nr:hypothetical protein [Lentisphaerota bacterium]